MNVGAVGNRGHFPLPNCKKQLVKCLFAPYSIFSIVCEGAPRMCTQLCDCLLFPCIWLLPLNLAYALITLHPIVVPFSAFYFCVYIKITTSSSQLSCIHEVRFIRAHALCHTHIATSMSFWLIPGQISLWIRPWL